MIKKILKAVLMLAVISVTGCATPKALDSAKKNLMLKKAIQNNDAEAIRDIRNGNIEKARESMKVTNWEATKAEPVKVVGAGVLDAILVYGGYQGARYIGDEMGGGDDDDKAPSTNNENNSGDTTILTILGDGNNVKVDNSKAPPVVPQTGNK